MDRYSDLLKKMIKESKLSLSEISEKMGRKGFSADKGYISKLQNKKRSPAGDDFNKALAEVLRGDSDQLVWSAYVDKAPEEAKKRLRIINNYWELLEDDILESLFELSKKYPDLIEGNLEVLSHLPEYENIKHVLRNSDDKNILKVAIGTIGKSKQKELASAILRDIEETDDGFIYNIFGEKNSLSSPVSVIIDLKETMKKGTTIEYPTLEDHKKGINKTEHGNANPSFVILPIISEINTYNDLISEQKTIGKEIELKSKVGEGTYFYLMVQDHSMISEGFTENQKVLVRVQDWVDNGKIAVILESDHKTMLKRAFYQNDSIILQSLHKDTPPKVLPINDVHILGQVVRVVFDV